jgi:hypothetical protein
MDYFFYKDVLGGWLLISYCLYCLIIFVKGYVLKRKSLQIINIPITRNTIINILLIISTYLLTIPVFTYYFGKILRLVYCQFIDRQDYYLIRQGFFSDDYDSKVITSIVGFYLFLIVKLIFSHITHYTIRKDNFIILSMFTFLVLIESNGKGNNIITYSHFLLTELILIIMYFIVRNEVIKDFFRSYL